MNSLWIALFSGMLIGGGAVVAMLFAGRIAGVSGLLSKMLIHPMGESFAGAFCSGIILAYPLVSLFMLLPVRHYPTFTGLLPSYGVLGIAGGLIGLGVGLASGCTSGHGVCGLARLSKRSLVAVLCFMGAAIVSATLKSILTA